MARFNGNGDGRPAVVRIKDLRVTRSSGEPIVEVSDLEVDAGTTHVVVGSSGVGKSTLLRVIAGLVPMRGRQVRGSVLWGDFDVFQASPSRRASERRRHLGYVAQDPFQALNPAYRVHEHLQDAIEPTDPNPLATIDAALRLAGLGPEFSQCAPEELSGGERQRVQFALVACRKPQLVVADEPTSGLDTHTAEGIVRSLRQLASELGAALIVATHDLATARRIGDRISVLRTRIVESGKDVLQHPQTEWGRELADAERSFSVARGRPERTKACPVLEATDITHVVTQRNGHRRMLLDNVKLEISSGESVGIFGPSGVGKTTLIRILTRLTPPTAGTVQLHSCEHDDGRRRPPRLAVVSQDAARSLRPGFTVEALLQEVLDTVPLGRWTVASLLAAVELPVSLAARRPTTLSGGERQRIAIARALGVEPTVLLLDEPVTALDAVTKAKVALLIEKLQQQHGFGMLVISHEWAALRRLCHRLIAFTPDGQLRPTDADVSSLTDST